MKKLIVLAFVLLPVSSFAQTVQELMNQIDVDRLEATVSEFSGEQPTMVYGTEVTIINRQHANNDLAADYIKERLEQFNNLTIEEQLFNTTGKNIIATQLGKTNPDNIYLVSAHYDAIADYCADDNATGVAAILEIARVLSTQCMENTIVYAFWDEEEIGLRGSRHYANLANADNLNILGVVNLDMMGYDGDEPGQPGDNDFDIDVRDLHGSLTIKDDLLNLLNTYTFNLNPITVNPGTSASDHASFWVNSFPAVLVGESWETNDETPFYHSSADRLSTLDLPYFQEITKLVTAYLLTKGNLQAIDNTLTSTAAYLEANQNGANYQWYNCDTNTLIAGAVNQTYYPETIGSYAVEITVGSCVEMSDCILFTNLSIEESNAEHFKMTPNPVTSTLQIDSDLETAFAIQLYNVSGQLILETTSKTKQLKIDMSDYQSGIYYLKIKGTQKSGAFKVVKQ